MRPDLRLIPSLAMLAVAAITALPA